MILELSSNIKPHELEDLIEQLGQMGYQTSIQKKEENLSLLLNQTPQNVSKDHKLKSLAHVKKINPLKEIAQLKAKGFDLAHNVHLGGQAIQLMAGPCSVESQSQIDEIAYLISKTPTKILRGGAFKPRSSPYSFQGLGEKGLKYLKDAAEKYQLLCVSEVMDSSDLDMMLEHVDILQVGSRNMQNYSLLKKLGQTQKPILLKRGMSATYKELLLSVEYILMGGNQRVILCERGIRTFETYTRNTLDLSAVPILKELSKLPVIVDPSHGVGIRKYVPQMALSALAAGADGLMLEVHTHPEKSYSDSDQTLSIQEFEKLVEQMSPLLEALKRA